MKNTNLKELNQQIAKSLRVKPLKITYKISESYC